MEPEFAKRINAEFKTSELTLLNPPDKHSTIILFRRLTRGMKLTREDRFEKYKEYLDDLARREVISLAMADKWKNINPWPGRPSRAFKEPRA